MLRLWNDVSLATGDFLLGWLLDLPGSLRIILVAMISAALLTVVRKFTTDQDLLRRASLDRRRLRVLLREARKSRDEEALRRRRATRSMVAMTALRAEGLPLLVSLPPIALLATWCVYRLEFHPPAAGETLTVTAYAPVSAVGDIVHIRPQPGLEADDWVKSVAAASAEAMAGGPPYGIARWTITGAARPAAYPLVFRLGRERFEHPLLLGERTYSAPLAAHGAVVTEIELRPLRLFGVLPGIPAIFFPPWLVGYLVLVIPATFFMKRVLRVY